MDFNVIKSAVSNQFDHMSNHALFTTQINKDKLWEKYLDSFPVGSNPIYRERTQHDCQCCKQFIRACGDVVGISDSLELVSIWDIDIGGDYQIVADAMSVFVKSQAIQDSFIHYQSNLGTNFNHQECESGIVIKWDHFFFQLPTKFVMNELNIGTELSKRRTDKELLQRGLEEISIEAVEIALELIDQRSIYRGEEFKESVMKFFSYLKAYQKVCPVGKDNYCWKTSAKIGTLGRIKNTAIGTLLVDLSSGVDLTEVVKLFESKVAPQNYKRPSAVVTKGMLKGAKNIVKELGIEDSLKRRYAIADDLTINNVLFADKSVKEALDVFDELEEQIPVDIKKFEKVEEVSISTFLKDILPKSKGIELLVENRHKGNLMSLIAPEVADSPNILKWDNNFSWAYHGEVADSMKERVKSAGGKVDGVLRFSIQWNDNNDNPNDFDAHCIEPNKNLIYYPNKGHVHPSSGMLDVDIQNPGNKVAVENITWSDKRKMQEGKYIFRVHNYCHNGGKTGFTAEIEYNEGVLHSFTYEKELRDNEKVIVAEAMFDKKKGLQFLKSLNGVSSAPPSQEFWEVTSNTFVPVSMIMNSPNHWDGNRTGNKHFFFILNGCMNNEEGRGFFNEFLNENLRDHRKVFEILGSKLRTAKSDKQLSGLGFSSTKRNSVLCKVTGAFSRTIKINF